LKILFLACIQGFVVLLILRNGDQNLPSRFPKGVSSCLYQSIFCSHPASTASNNFKFNKQKQRQNFFDYGQLLIRFLLFKQEMNLFSNISTEHSSHISR